MSRSLAKALLCGLKNVIPEEVWTTRPSQGDADDGSLVIQIQSLVLVESNT